MHGGRTAGVGVGRVAYVAVHSRLEVEGRRPGCQEPRESLGVFDWSSSVTYVLTGWSFLTILYSTGSGNEAM